MEHSELQAVETGVGSDLRRARETAGLTRGDIAAQTKIAERHIISIEEGRFADLAGRTYAVGFARAYARNVGLDEGNIAERVKREMDAQQPRVAQMPSGFEPGDPARVPPQRLAWIAAGSGVILLAVLAAFWSSLLSPEAQMPDLLADAPPPAAAGPKSQPSARPAVANGPVSIEATQDGVWVRVKDADKKTLLERELKKGESWTVPADATGATLRTGRPDALAIRIGNRTLAPLADKPVTISDVSLAAEDLVARGKPAATSAPTIAPAARPGVSSSARPSPQPVAISAPSPAATARPAQPRLSPTPRSLQSPAPRPTVSAGTETSAEAVSPVSTAEPAAASPTVSTETR